MADQQAQCHGCGTGCKVVVEATDQDMKEYHLENPTLGEQLHRSLSNSSSSSDDEEGVKKEKKKKSKTTGSADNVDAPDEKKGLIEKLKEKLPGHEKKPEEHTSHILEPEPECSAEKKGILEKIKDKLPGHEKKPEEHTRPVPKPEPEYPAEKKGIMEKIKEKLPCSHNNADDEKVKEN